MVKILIIISLLAYTALGEKCYALNLEGGGSHGAYEAGCIYQLAHSLPADEIKWNVVTGISTGAINSGVVSQFAPGD